MARFSGEIGYGTSVETPADSGIWVDTIVEYPYFGNVTQKNRRAQVGESLNDNFTVGNLIEIIADQYAVENFAKIRYIRWEGQTWTITNVTVQRPRLLLDLGDIYNGPFPVEESP